MKTWSGAGTMLRKASKLDEPKARDHEKKTLSYVSAFNPNRRKPSLRLVVRAAAIGGVMVRRLD